MTLLQFKCLDLSGSVQPRPPGLEISFASDGIFYLTPACSQLELTFSCQSSTPLSSLIQLAASRERAIIPIDFHSEVMGPNVTVEIWKLIFDNI